MNCHLIIELRSFRRGFTAEFLFATKQKKELMKNSPQYQAYYSNIINEPLISSTRLAFLARLAVFCQGRFSFSCRPYSR